MGIKRKLSRLWEETRDGILRGPGVDVDSVNTVDGAIGDLNARFVGGGDEGSLAMQLTSAAPNLFVRNLEDNIVDGFDPDIYHRSHFADNEYRFTVTDANNTNTDLYKTSDFKSITKVGDAIFGSGSDDMRVGDHVILPDGTFVVYVARNAAVIEVWTGTDLTNLTYQGDIFDYQADPAGIVDSRGTVHLFPEKQESGDTTPVIEHYTTPVDDLFNVTQQSDALDLTNRDIETGDLDLMRLAGRYYAFLDNKLPPYKIGYAVSDNLYDWELQQDQINGVDGGDMTVTKYGGKLVGMTEQSGKNQLDGQNTTVITSLIEPYQESAWWRARSRDVDYQYQADSLDGLQPADVSGSGSVGLVDGSDGVALEASTGTTSGSHARIKKKILPGFPEMGWNEQRVFQAHVDMVDLNGPVYLVTGDVTPSSKTSEHFGFLADGDTLGSTNGNGADDTRQSLSVSNTGKYVLRAEYYPDDRIDYFVNDQLRERVTSRLPSPTSATNADHAFTVLAENSTTTDRTIRLHQVQMGKMPTVRQ